MTTADSGLGLRNVLSDVDSRGLALRGLLGDRVVGSSARWGAATGIVCAASGIYHHGVLHVACQTALIFASLWPIYEHGEEIFRHDLNMVPRLCKSIEPIKGNRPLAASPGLLALSGRSNKARHDYRRGGLGF